MGLDRTSRLSAQLSPGYLLVSVLNTSMENASWSHPQMGTRSGNVTVEDKPADQCGETKWGTHRCFVV